MMMYRKSGLILILPVAAFAFVCWLILTDDPSSAAHEDRSNRATMAVVRSSTANEWAASMNPFSSLPCQLPNGQKINSTACSANHAAIAIGEDASPEAKANYALNQIVELRAYDKLNLLAQAYQSCFNGQSKSIETHESPKSQETSACDLAKLEGIVKKAESSMFLAANQGDYMAQQAYVDLLVVKLAMNQSLEVTREASQLDSQSLSRMSDEVSRNNLVRNQIISFVQGLKEPSETLIETSQRMSLVRKLANEQQ